MEKKYDVYGIGNALVDIIVEVDNEFFRENEIEKGIMTLVDEDRQHQLLQAIANKNAKMQCGGSAANTVIGLSQFGGTGYYSCKVARDIHGGFYIKDLKSNGVSTNVVHENCPEGITGKCLVMVTPDAERTMNTYLGITSDFSVNELNESILKDSKFIYIEGYLVAAPPGREAMREAIRIADKSGVETALTFSDPSMVKYFRDEMEAVIGASVDLIFCNEEEAMLFTQKDNLEAAAEALKKSAKRFVITKGANGAYLYDGDTYIDIHPFPVKAIDTNGAGDLFAGAFLYGITHGHSFAEAGKIASLAASVVVQQYGPRLQKGQATEILQRILD